MSEYHNRKKVNLIFFLYNKPVISEEITGLMIMRLTFQVHPTHRHQPATQKEEKTNTRNALNLQCISINYVHFVHQEHCTQSIQYLWLINRVCVLCIFTISNIFIISKQINSLFLSDETVSG